MEDSGDGKLDVNNANFDPLLALYSDRVDVPRPDVLVLDNVAKFESLHANCKGSAVRIDEMLKSNQVKKKEPEPSTSREIKPRFQVTQDSVPRKRKPLTNVLTRISNISGPLAFLKDCMEKRIRIKVWTRNATGIRGYCLGFVVAFDKHWNLAMSDVNEVWSRRAKRKSISLGGDLEPPKPWKLMGPMVTPPKIVILKTEKGIQTCERHVNQMLMRAFGLGNFVCASFAEEVQSRQSESSCLRTRPQYGPFTVRYCECDCDDDSSYPVLVLEQIMDTF